MALIYTAPITVSSATTIKAYATKSGALDSEVSEAQYANGAPIAKIRVQGDLVGGGYENYQGFFLTDVSHSKGTKLSGTYTSSLYAVNINEVLSLDTSVEMGQYFCLGDGGAGTAAITRTFTFYDAADNVLDSVVGSESVGLNDIIRDFDGTSDKYWRFRYFGANDIRLEQITAP
jgi:hypothetical protein